MKIKEIKENKKQFLPLLLLADEQEDMIDRYLNKGTMYVLDDDGVKCECVITDEGNGVLEIKNIATEPEYQGKDYGKALIDFVATTYKGKYSILQVVKKINVSYVGMVTRQLAVGAEPMDIKLNTSENALDEVVVTAFGVKRDRKGLGYAVQDIKAEDLNTSGTTSLASAMQGKLSGVEIKPSSGAPGASSNITMGRTAYARFTNRKTNLDNQPRTGDDTKLELWAGLTVLCFLGAVVSLVVSKKRKNKYNR